MEKPPPKNLARRHFLSGLGAILAIGCSRLKIAGSPEASANELTGVIGQRNKVASCIGRKKLTGESILNEGEKIQAQLQAIRDYVDQNKLALPEFEFGDISWGEIGISKRKVAEELVEHCSDIDESVLEQNDDALLQDRLVESHPRLIRVLVHEPEPKVLEVVTFHVKCNLVSNKNGAAGIHIASESNTLALVKHNEIGDAEVNFRNIARHEGTHDKNDNEFEIREENNKYKRKFKIGDLLSAEEVALLGFPECHRVDYRFFNEMSADAIQILMNDIASANMEFRNAASERTSNDRGMFYLMNSIFFRETGSEENFNKTVEAILNDGTILSNDDLRMLGELMYIIATKAMRKIKQF